MCTAVKLMCTAMKLMCKAGGAGAPPYARLRTPSNGPSAMLQASTQEAEEKEYGEACGGLARVIVGQLLKE